MTRFYSACELKSTKVTETWAGEPFVLQTCSAWFGAGQPIPALQAIFFLKFGLHSSFKKTMF